MKLSILPRLRVPEIVALKMTTLYGVPAVPYAKLLHRQACPILCLPTSNSGQDAVKELKRWLMTGRLKREALLGLSWCGSQASPGTMTNQALEELVKVCLELRKFLPPLHQVWGHHNPQVTSSAPLVKLLTQLPWAPRPELHLSHCSFGSVQLQRLFRTAAVSFAHEFSARVEGNPMRDLWLTLELALPEFEARVWFYDVDSFKDLPRELQIFIGEERPLKEQDLLQQPKARD